MKRVRFMIFLSVLVSVLFTALPLFAEQVEWNGALVDSSQVPPETTPTNMQVLDPNFPALPPSTYGTSDWTTYSAGPCDAFNRDATHDTYSPNCNYIAPASLSSSTYVGFPVHLPNGADIQYVDMLYYDNDTTNDPGVGLWYVDTNGTYTLIQSLAPGAFSGGNKGVRFGPFTHTVANWVSGAPYGQPRTYVILAWLGNGASTYNRIYGFTIWYTLQISPAPGTATFSDVPTSHTYFQYIEALVDSGITVGCGGGKYCPDSYLTRGQMAVFLSRALGLHWPN